MDLKIKWVDRKTYKPKKACVYVISHPENVHCLATMMGLIQYNDEIYVGVTTGEIQQRWRDHKTLRKRDNQETSRFIKRNRYDFDECFRVIFEGTEDQCYRLEYHLRQEANMGLNKKVGGKLRHRKLRKHYIDMIERASTTW